MDARKPMDVAAQGAQDARSLQLDPRANPYAPPAAMASLDHPQDRGPADYGRERRSVLGLLALCCITLGLYPCVWYVRRARFFDRLNADAKVGWLPWIIVVLGCASVAVEVAQPGRQFEAGASALRLAFGISVLVVSFRMAHMLRSDLARSGRLLDVSGAGVFFFGCLYLQHVLNEAADTPPRLHR